MGSSNRHWPSLFKSKPCNTQQWQSHHDINPCAHSSSSGGEERSPEPKPRWNPKPEQIRILESIFNSGMVNPPRDEIRKIRAQLQEYGQVGDANVFYWFQNRKSRSKHKQRSKAGSPGSQQRPMMSGSPSNSSTTSSDKSSPKKLQGGMADETSTNMKNISNNNTNNNTNTNTNTNTTNNNNNVVVDQGYPYFQPGQDEQFVGQQEPVFFPLQQSSASLFNHGSGLGLGFGFDPISKAAADTGLEKLKFNQEHSFLVTNSPSNSSGMISSNNLGQILGVGESCGVAGKSTVFVDNMTIEVPSGPFNIREYFGEDAILVYPSGHPVVTNEWGVTIHPLQNGAFYYIVRHAVTASPLLEKLNTTVDLVEPEFPYQI